MTRALGVALMVLAVVLGVAGFWVWALFGISYEVGTAIGVTAVAAGLTGFVVSA